MNKEHQILIEEVRKAVKEKNEQRTILTDDIYAKLSNENKVKIAEEMYIKLADERLRQPTEEKDKPPVQAQPVASVLVLPTVQTPPIDPVHAPPSPDISSKIERMIEEIKKRKVLTQVQAPVCNRPPRQYDEPNRDNTRIPIISPDQGVDDGVACPTCHNGRIRSIELGGVSYKCTGPNCGKEYIMVDKAADYKCVNCGIPIKRPDDGKIQLYACPNCKGKKAVKFDWRNVWKV
jgi:DNA-directed RNA polymerase subunit RPC12/RpoP